MTSSLDTILGYELARLARAVEGRRVQSPAGGTPAPGTGVSIVITKIGHHSDVYVSALTGQLYDGERQRQPLADAAALGDAIEQAIEAARALPLTEATHPSADTLARTLGIAPAAPVLALAAE